MMFRRPLTFLPTAALAGVAACVAVGAAAQTAQPTVDKNVAVLQALDKVTARVSRLEVPVGQEVEFGTLTIAVRACRSTRPEEPPESAAFLQVEDAPPAGEARRVFSGWMFASSPAVSAMTHPVYDIWVNSCADELSPPPGAEEVAQERGRYALPGAPPPPPPLPEAKQ